MRGRSVLRRWGISCVREVVFAVKKTLRQCVGVLPVVAVFALLLRMPAEAAAGARQGLSLCTEVILPSLLPFLILSSLSSALGLPALLAALCAPLLRRLGVPPVCAAPLLLGLTGGYPVGASALAALVRAGALRAEAASDALPWCNNTGPGFIVGVAGAAVFSSVRAGIALYFCHALAALALAALSIRRNPHPVPDMPTLPTAAGNLAAALPESVQSAALCALGICAYVVFFSVLSALLRSAGVFSALAAWSSLHLGTELRAAYALLCGLLELGSGIGAMRSMAPTPGNAALAAFLLGFGGLSVHCQTLFAVSGTEIKCARHFAGRIIHGCLSALLAFLLFKLLRI